MDDEALQKLAEAHLDSCYEAMDGWDEGEDEDRAPSPAVGPFCGCTTCVVREVLTVAYDELVRRVEEAQPPRPAQEILFLDAASRIGYDRPM